MIGHELTDPFRYLLCFLSCFSGILCGCSAAGSCAGSCSTCAFSCLCSCVLLFDLAFLTPAGEGIGAVLRSVLGKLAAPVQGIGTGIVVSFLVDLVMNSIRDQRGCMAAFRRLPAVTRCLLYGLIREDGFIKAQLLTGCRLGSLFALKLLSGSFLGVFLRFQFASRRRPAGGAALAGPSGS